MVYAKFSSLTRRTNMLILCMIEAPTWPQKCCKAKDAVLKLTDGVLASSCMKCWLAKVPSVFDAKEDITALYE
ncbi:hypothetical protein L798_04415 [Zootermopsis nevadensis]|uniref:Uncharacterized protein n=1 Tax=Zootermopsis nevadensis TaxID=136037 RepID=A0A067QQ34_ZOONE|nr:hypothetical protein L798_04415 [Zootermopsis nevadensis]